MKSARVGVQELPIQSISNEKQKWDNMKGSEVKKNPSHTNKVNQMKIKMNMNDIKGIVMIIIPFPIIMHKYLYIMLNGFVGSVADVSLHVFHSMEKKISISKQRIYKC